MGNYFFQPRFPTTPLMVLGVVDGIRHFFKDLYFPDEEDSVEKGTGIYRSVFALNDFALRRRSSDLNTPFAMLPFVNFKHTDIKDFEEFGWTSQGYNQGIMTDDGFTVKVYPSIIRFEATVWVNKSADLFMAQKLLSTLKRRGKVYFNLSPYLKIGNTPIDANVILNFEDGKINQFTDKDWLKINKVQTYSFDFTARFFDYVISAEADIPVEVYEIFLASTDNEILSRYWVDADTQEVTDGAHPDSEQTDSTLDL